ncbi:MAG: phosphotransferase family protein [Thermoplasmata archaeon]
MVEELTASDLLDLIKGSFPSLKISKIAINNRGWDNLVAIVNDAVVFRFPKSPAAENSMKSEIKLIRKLVGFPVELPDYTYISESERFFAGYPLIHGVALNTSSTLGKGLMRDIKSILKYLRNLDISIAKSAGIQIYDRASWLKRHQGILDNFEQSLSDITGNAYFSELRKELIDALSGISRECFSIAHGDLYRGNILISQRHDRINGVIDWGDAFYGDYAFDVAAVTLDFSHRYSRELVRELSQESDETAMKRIFYYSKVEPLYLADKLMRKGHSSEAKRIVYEIMKKGGKD